MKKIILTATLSIFTAAAIAASPLVVVKPTPLVVNNTPKVSLITDTYISFNPLLELTNSLVDTSSTYDINYGFDFNVQNYYRGSNSGSSVSLSYLVGEDYNELNVKAGYAYKISSNSNLEPYISISPEFSFAFSDGNDSTDLETTYIGLDGVLGLRYFVSGNSSFALNAGIDTSALYKLTDLYNSSDADYKYSATAFVGFTFSLGNSSDDTKNAHR
jgi:hypothetical protein